VRRNNYALRYLVLILVLSLAGCSVLPPAERQALMAHGLPVRVTVDAPFFPQEIHQCGPAALASVLVWTGVGTTPQALTPQLYLPTQEGSLQLELLAATRRAGRIPYVLEPEVESLLREVAAGQPVVVLQNLGLSWYPRWHYAVVVGYDLESATITLHSGRERNYIIALDTFLRTWARSGRWALLVLPPTQLPVTAGELAYLKAVTDMEQIGQREVALMAYQTALRRWPESVTAWLGLGNVQYGLNDKTAALASFRAAVNADPNSAPAHNNLAHMLAEQGRWDEALQHARRAVELGGERFPQALQTLQEIELRQRQTGR